MSRRLDINVIKLMETEFDKQVENVYNIGYDDAVKIATKLAEIQQQDTVPDEIIGFDSNWR